MKLVHFRQLLEATLAEASKRSLTRHIGDPIYGYCLFTSDGYSYISDCIFSVKGLESVVGEYQLKSFYPTIEEARRQLRWSPCDSPYQLENEELFSECSALLDEIWKEADSHSEAAQDELYRSLNDVFLCSLAKIRDKGLFGTACVFTLFAGDQCDAARLVNAEKINDPEVCRQFAAELCYVDPNRLACLRTNRWPTDESYEA